MIERFYYLDDNQSEILAFRILELKENGVFSDEVADELLKAYSDNLAKKATANEFVQELFPNKFKVKIPESSLNYLMELTQRDVFDPETISSHIEHKAQLERRFSSKEKK